MPEFNDQPTPVFGDGGLPHEPHLGGTDFADDPITVEPVGKRRRIRKHPLRRRIILGVCGVLALCVLAYAGFYGYILYKVENDIKHSDALKGIVAPPTGKGMDLLLMGLDTRLDENGHALPADVYNALHAGTAQDGGNNSNVLMYIHVSDDGSHVTAISIPRDDWVDVANCKTDYALRQFVQRGCKAKIKEAYGFAFNEALDAHKTFQQAKDAARLEEIETVEHFLNVKINSFVEVTMGAFYQIAQQVQPITVCVKENTTDSFSGANFHAGRQQLSAAQAVAFVRQRRDLDNRYNFSDLDRARRQQAFIISLLTQLKGTGTLLNPVTLNNIVDVATNNVVISSGLDPITIAKLASNLSGGNIHFYTLPIVNYGKAPNGEDINLVNVPQIQAIVASLLNPATPATTKPVKPLPSGAGYTVDAVNSSGVNHAAANQLTALNKFKYKSGTATDGQSVVSGSTIRYNPADLAQAQALAKRLGGSITLTPTATAKSHVLTLVIGTTLANATAGTGSTTPSAVPTAVNASGGGTNGPATNQLTDMQGGGIPCVK